MGLDQRVDLEGAGIAGRLMAPDVLVKGGDYKTGEIVGREFAKKVVRFPLLKGRSTTNIIKKVSK